MSDAPTLNTDFLDLLIELSIAGAEFVIVGAHALAVHGVPRATGDIDIFIRPIPANAERVLHALRLFGAPVDSHHLTSHDLTRPSTVYQIGLPPRRIDLLTSIDGCTFDDAWKGRTEVEIDGQSLPFLGRRELVQNKRAAGRPKDLLDLELLKETERAD